MEIKGMRWGYDGGGVGCGPIEGNMIVEVTVLDKDGHYYFVTDSAFCEFDAFRVSELPQFDILMHLSSSYTDFDYEFKKIQDITIEQHDTELGYDDFDHHIFEMTDEMKKSKFAKVFEFAHKAMEQLDLDEAEAVGTAEKYIAPYIGEEL